MIYLKSILALDKKTIDLDQVTSNLNAVPSWLIGESLSLSKWNIQLNTALNSYELGEFDYPIQVNHEFTSQEMITSIKLYRSIGENELYFELKPVSVYGINFDMRIEFTESDI